jgi:hypothetical protein
MQDSKLKKLPTAPDSTWDDLCRAVRAHMHARVAAPRRPDGLTGTADALFSVLSAVHLAVDQVREAGEFEERRRQVEAAAAWLDALRDWARNYFWQPLAVEQEAEAREYLEKRRLGE